MIDYISEKSAKPSIRVCNKKTLQMWYWGQGKFELTSDKAIRFDKRSQFNFVFDDLRVMIKDEFEVQKLYLDFDY